MLRREVTFGILPIVHMILSIGARYLQFMLSIHRLRASAAAMALTFFRCLIPSLADGLGATAVQNTFEPIGGTLGFESVDEFGVVPFVAQELRTIVTDTSQDLQHQVEQAYVVHRLRELDVTKVSRAFFCVAATGLALFIRIASAHPRVIQAIRDRIALVERFRLFDFHYTHITNGIG
jgi:hypothetical protein